MILMYDLPLQNAIMIFFQKKKREKKTTIHSKDLCNWNGSICHTFLINELKYEIIPHT